MLRKAQGKVWAFHRGFICFVLNLPCLYTKKYEATERRI